MRTILAATALVLATLPTTVANAQTVPTCFGREATVVGTDGDDSLYKPGTGPDTWVGLRGDDTFDWEDYTGRDYMCGNSGNDYFGPFSLDDRVDGAGGRDVIRLGDGVDKGFGGPGNDTIYNAEPPDRFLVDGDIDVLDGGDGTDTCYAEAIDIVRNCEVIVQVP